MTTAIITEVAELFDLFFIWVDIYYVWRITKMKNLAIYTVITGNYDTVKQPQVITPGADYYLFTNNHSFIDAGV